jgi:hypothetical protein
MQWHIQHSTLSDQMSDPVIQEESGSAYTRSVGGRGGLQAHCERFEARGRPIRTRQGFVAR